VNKVQQAAARISDPQGKQEASIRQATKFIALNASVLQETYRHYSEASDPGLMKMARATLDKGIAGIKDQLHTIENDLDK
jgi:polyhydroxyalkanoate synthesis regulator protein